MKRLHSALLAAAAAAMATGGTFAVPVTPAGAQMAVFDASNYAKNLLQAARALEQIDNQLKSLQNETAMLGNMATNLKTIPFPQLQSMSSAMQRIDRLMGEAKGIDFKVEGLDRQIEALFPGELHHALGTDQQVSAARARLDAASAAYRQSMTVQAGIAEQVAKDSGVLGGLAESSQSAVGALQVGQAANQLMALGIKQQLQIQNLMASEFRDQALERARRIQAEEDGRAATRRFLEGDPRN
jgi:type IV secretion system protein TrbJ